MSASPGHIQPELESAGNPFFQQFVTEAWIQAPADVAEINALAFRRCLDVVEQSRLAHVSGAIILHGGVGSGKTHVLSRLREALASADAAREPVFVYVLLAAGASRLSRLVREHFVDSLLRPWRDHSSRLVGLVQNQLREQSWEQASARLRLGHSLETVLGHVLAGRFPTKTASWLRGESLPDSVLESMGLKESAEWDDMDEERRSMEVIQALCRLADPLPVVFCCDQAEALRASAGDTQGFFSYGQLAAAIRNSIPNSILISSIQTALLEDFRRGIAHESNYQRLGDAVVLEAVNRRQGAVLLARRLDAEPVLAAARARRKEPNLWPLDESKLDSLYDQGGRTPARRLLHRAAELFEEVRNRQLPDEGELDSYLEDRCHSLLRSSKAWEGPAHTDAILEHGLPVLAGLLGISMEGASSGGRDGVSFRFSARDAGISLCSQENQTALSRRLGRLAGARRRNLILIRDVRLELKETPRAAQHMKALADQGARWVRPTPEALAALDALRRLHDGYGALSHRGESVSPASVAQWLRENLPGAAERLARELFETTPPFPVERLLQELSRAFVLDVRSVAESLRVPVNEVIAYAQTHANQVLLVTGPNPVVCLVAGAAAEDSGDAD